MESASVALSRGTYYREPDGATRMYHSPFFYGDAAFAFRDRRPDWKLVSDYLTEVQVKEYFGGNLRPGEYGEIRFP